MITPKNSFCSRSAIGPRRPLPIVIRSTERIGVISDTHIDGRRRVIPAAVWQTFAGVDCILHAGDIARQDVLDALAALAPVHAVYGNMDPPELGRGPVFFDMAIV